MGINLNKVFELMIQSKNLALKSSTVSSYYSVFSNHCDFKFDDINTLEESKINQYLFEEKEKKALADKTMYDIITLLNSLLSYSYAKGYMKEKINLTPPKIADSPVSVFSDTEINKLVEYISNNFTFTGLGVLLCLYCGLRIGELCALTWQDIDLSKKVLKIRKTMQRIKDFDTETTYKTKVVITTPKTPKSVRDVPIPDFLIPLLLKYKGKPNWYVLTANVKYMEPRVLQAKYKRLLYNAGVSYRNYHTLRHYFATHANNLGIDIKTLSEILGHENVAFTLKKYVHPSLELKRNQINSIYTGIELTVTVV